MSRWEKYIHRLALAFDLDTTHDKFQANFMLLIPDKFQHSPLLRLESCEIYTELLEKLRFLHPTNDHQAFDSLVDLKQGSLNPLEYAIQFEEYQRQILLPEGQAIRLFSKNANTYLRLELERAQRITGSFTTIREYVVYCRNLHYDYTNNQAHKHQSVKKTNTNTVNFLVPQNNTEEEDEYPLHMVSPSISPTRSRSPANIIPYAEYVLRHGLPRSPGSRTPTDRQLPDIAEEHDPYYRGPSLVYRPDSSDGMGSEWFTCN